MGGWGGGEVSKWRVKERDGTVGGEGPGEVNGKYRNGNGKYGKYSLKTRVKDTGYAELRMSGLMVWCVTFKCLEE